MVCIPVGVPICSVCLAKSSEKNNETVRPERGIVVRDGGRAGVSALTSLGCMSRAGLSGLIPIGRPVAQLGSVVECNAGEITAGRWHSTGAAGQAMEAVTRPSATY